MNDFFQVSEIRTFSYPDHTSAEAVLAEYCLTTHRFLEHLQGVLCSDPGTQGLQISLGGDLARSCEVLFRNAGLEASQSPPLTLYAKQLGERSDVAAAHPVKNGRLYVEVEFRPNFEKDLAKFRVGHRSGRLDLAVLIVAGDRNSINAEYTTMPEFAKVARVVKAFEPDHPLLVMGITGQRTAVAE